MKTSNQISNRKSRRRRNRYTPIEPSEEQILVTETSDPEPELETIADDPLPLVPALEGPESVKEPAPEVQSSSSILLSASNDLPPPKTPPLMTTSEGKLCILI